MTVKHRMQCFESDVLVCHNGEKFNLNIQARTNPLGFGRTLAEYPSQEEAVAAAERFCLAYRIARERGYYLKEDALVRPERESLPVRWVLEQTKSEQEWVELLMSKADAS